MKVEKFLKKNLNTKSLVLYFKFFKILFTKNSYNYLPQLFSSIFNIFFFRVKGVLNNYQTFLFNKKKLYKNVS